MVRHLQMVGSLPEPDLFSFPPTTAPAPLPPVDAPMSIMHPFNIPDSLFTAALDARVPITLAVTYAITVKLLSNYNRSAGKKPWSISKTKPFNIFVIAHNIFLAVYSAWTFWGMLGGLMRSVVNPFGPPGLAGTADSFCRLHGEPGLGRSIYFNDTTLAYQTSPGIDSGAFAANGLPSETEAGRMWNEGLAYYGWIFYLSKFYEVLDTFIILAKGKPSSTLQTYHHAGAMMCMWAGMRYMSAPIWMFVLVNSFIHAIMYFYYTLTTFNVKVPIILKRTLTSMQITQFLVGATYAMSHSFVSYTVPQTTTTSTTPKSRSVFSFASKSTTTTTTTYTTEPCITTAGETFAIWLNVVYLAPLTYLFVSFFIASYVKRSNAAERRRIPGKDPQRHGVDVGLAEKAGWDAARDVEREVYGGGVANGESSSVGAAAAVAEKPKKASRGSKKTA